MDTTALKKFAQSARSLLMEQVRSKLDLVLDPSSAARREHPKAMGELDAAITRESKAQVIEQVAYTWFNRFTALRFMDVNSYTSTGVVSPAEGQTRPEILSEAMAGNLPDGAPANITSLLDGRTPSSDPQSEAYRLLLVHACNQWHDQMPFLFEKLDDFTELLMPEDLLSQASILAEMRKVMTQDVCQDVEVIGWLYQFYISEKKDQVFAGLKKNQKITAENIPAATQLFTPHWIVRYLVENSLGRLWLLNRPTSKLAAQMDYYIAPEEPETDFLKIGKPEEIKVCDPACGSGHMLTYAFDLLYAIYEEEGYDPAEIPALILKHNLFGIEIDDRAGALAAFALAMKAASRLGRRRYMRMEVTPNICVLQDVAFSAAEMQDVATVVGGDLFTTDLRETLGQFEQAKNFGSLIVPKLRDPAEVARLVRLKDFGGDLLLREVQDRVLNVLEMAEALSPKYHVVVANPPYAAASGLNDQIQKFAERNYSNSQTDLFGMFIERSLSLAVRHGLAAMVTIQNWMFLGSFEKLRRYTIDQASIVNLLQIGFNSFPELNSKVVQAAAFVIENAAHGKVGIYINANDAPQSANKDEIFRHRKSSGSFYLVSSDRFAKIPGSPIAYWLSQAAIQSFESGTSLSHHFSISEGLKTGENEKFIRLWHEPAAAKINNFQRAEKWVPHSKGGEFRRWYGNYDWVVDWGRAGNALRASGKAGFQGLPNYGKKGGTWSKITSSPFCVRLQPDGLIFDSACPGLFEAGQIKIEQAMGYLNSKACRMIISALNPTLNYQVGNVSCLPVAQNVSYGDIGFVTTSKLISLSKSDWDAYETSRDFSTLPLLSTDYCSETLEATYNALRTHWQSMTDEMQQLEEENNRIFIDAYGLQDELTSEVPQAEITLTCNPVYSLKGTKTDEKRETDLLTRTMTEYLHYAVGCMFGRYSLDEPGLILANQGETLADYLARIPNPSFMPDKDNVIPVLDGDWFADDITERFRQFLRVTFGEMHFRENLKFIEDSLGKDIRRYFTKDFYADHVKRYKKRPIYWMFSSPKGSFQALIYMHRYRPDTVSIMLNEYLREFVSKLEAERGRLEKLSDNPSVNQAQRTKALKDEAVVAKQIDELTEWERDVVFPLAQAKIEIDLDDGVKANYPKFGAALKKIPGLEDGEA